MPQFGVYRNPGGNTEIPFLVQVQSSRLEARVGRVLIPLIRWYSSGPPNHPLTPHLAVLGQSVFANPMEMLTLRSKQLSEPLAVLPERDQDSIIRAIDEMISRA